MGCGCGANQVVLKRLFLVMLREPCGVGAQYLPKNNFVRISQKLTLSGKSPGTGLRSKASVL